MCIMRILSSFTEATGGEAKAAAAKAPTGAASTRAGTAEATATATEATGATTAGARQRRRPVLPLQLGQWLIETRVISRSTDSKAKREKEECNLKSDYELLLCYIIIQNSALLCVYPRWKFVLLYTPYRIHVHQKYCS